MVSKNLPNWGPPSLPFACACLTQRVQNNKNFWKQQFVLLGQATVHMPLHTQPFSHLMPPHPAKSQQGGIKIKKAQIHFCLLQTALSKQHTCFFLSHHGVDDASVEVDAKRFWNMPHPTTAYCIVVCGHQGGERQELVQALRDG